MGKDVFADIADSYIQTSDKLAAALSPTISPEKKPEVYPFADYYAAKQPKPEASQLKDIPESVLGKKRPYQDVSTEELLKISQSIPQKPLATSFNMNDPYEQKRAQISSELALRNPKKPSLVTKALNIVAPIVSDPFNTLLSPNYRNERALENATPQGGVKGLITDTLNATMMSPEVNIAQDAASVLANRQALKYGVQKTGQELGQTGREYAQGAKTNAAAQLGLGRSKAAAKTMTTEGKEPWQMTKVDPATLVFREKQQNRIAGLEKIATEDMYPIVTIIDDNGARTILDGHNRATVAIKRGDTLDAVGLTRKEYNYLKSKDFDDMEISYAALLRAEENSGGEISGIASHLDSQFPGAGVTKRGIEASNILDNMPPELAAKVPAGIQKTYTLDEIEKLIDDKIDSIDPNMSVADINKYPELKRLTELRTSIWTKEITDLKNTITSKVKLDDTVDNDFLNLVLEQDFRITPTTNAARFTEILSPANAKQIKTDLAHSIAERWAQKNGVPWEQAINYQSENGLLEKTWAKKADEIYNAVADSFGKVENKGYVLDAKGPAAKYIEPPPQATTQATQAGKGVKASEVKPVVSSETKPQEIVSKVKRTPIGSGNVGAGKPPKTPKVITGTAKMPEPSIPAGTEATLKQAKAIVQRDKSGVATRLMDYVPGLKQVRHGLQPALDMPENITTGWVGQGLARGSVDTSLQQARIGQLEQLERVFGKGATATQDFKPAGVIFKGIPEQAKYPYVGTLADIMTRPSLYELSAEQKAALSTIQSNRSAGFNSVKAAYNLDINEFPVEAGGVHLPNVDVSEDAITMSGSLQNALNRGRSKERFYNTAADRWAHDNTFRPETTISKLLAANDTTLANMSGQKVFLEGIGGKTRLEVIQETHPELAAKMLNLRKRVQKLQGYKSILKEEQGQALDDFLNSPIEVADLDELRSALDVKLVPGRYVAKAQAGKDLLTVQKEINGVKAQIAALRPAWNTANLKPYTFVQDGVFRYLPIDEANQVRNLLKTTNSPWLRFVDNLRATAFGGDLSPITIQGATAWFSDPIGASRFIAQGKGGLTQASLLSDMKANPESWQRFVAATGINPLGGVEQEFATGFLSQIPKGIGKGWADWNEALYRPITKMQKDIFESSYQGAIKRGLTPKQAAAIGADDATKIIPRYNFRRLGQSQAEAAKYRAAVTSVSFLTQPAALTNDALKGLVKIATKQTITPTESFAVKRVVTLVATTTAIAVASNVYYAKNHGLDEEQAARDSIDPNSGKFMSLVLPNGAKIGLGGPFRGLIRAVVPKKIEGVAVPMPFAGLYNFAKNRMNPAVRIVWDEVRNKDYEGNRIRSGNFPINVLKGLEYAFEGSVPLTIGTIAQNKRTGEDWGTLGQETASQFMGTNYQADDPIYTASLRWDKDLSDYNSIPSNTIELKTAQKKDSTIKSRTDYRDLHPDVDAKLFIAGDVSSLSSARGVTSAIQLIEENNIDYKEISGVKKHLSEEAQKKKKGVTIKASGTDYVASLIKQLEMREKGANTPPTQPTQTSTPTSTPTPQATQTATATPKTISGADNNWSFFESIGGSQLLTILDGVWYQGKPLTPEQLSDLQMLYKIKPLGQTNFNTWYKQTLRQLYEKSVTAGVK